MVTPALEKTFGRAGANRVRDVLHEASPARRICTVEEVARFVSVLAGNSAAWFNSATIDFTGGEMQGHFEALLARSAEER